MLRLLRVGSITQRNLRGRILQASRAAFDPYIRRIAGAGIGGGDWMRVHRVSKRKVGALKDCRVYCQRRVGIGGV